MTSNSSCIQGEFVLGQTLEWVELPNDLVARLEGRSSLGRLGLLIHSTAGYVDPGWKGNLTLELSNVANLPIALYYGMRIGQISFFKMSSPVDRPYGSPSCARATRGRRNRPRRRSMGLRRGPLDHVAINDAVDWGTDLGGGTRVALIQAGTFRSDAGALFGPVPRIIWDRLVHNEIDAENRLLQALNCLLIETPSSGSWSKRGSANGSTRRRAMRRYEGPAIIRHWRPRTSCPRPSTSWR